MSNAAKNGQNLKSRQVEEIDGMLLEYGNIYVPMFKLFGFSDQDVKDVPRLKSKVPVRQYYLPGTDEIVEHTYVPTLDPNHVFDVMEVAITLDYLLKGEGFSPYFFGLHGTGKTSFYDQIHARLGLPKMLVILGEDSEVIDLGGQFLPTETGGMEFHYGFMVQAMKNGWTIQFDEYDLLPTRQQKMLNDVLENRRFGIEAKAEVVEAHANWRAVFTGNTNNTGTGSNMFVKGGGDASVNDRFFFFEKEYLTKDQEKKILKAVAEPYIQKHPEVLALRKDKAAQDQKMKSIEKLMVGDDSAASPIPCLVDHMLLVCERVRKAHINSFKANGSGHTLDCTMSTRSLKKWLIKTLELNAFYAGATPKLHESLLQNALKLAFLNGIDAQEADIVLEIFNSSIKGN
jgi:hypothetical protein